MLPEKQCIEYWQNYLDQHENQLTDHQYQIVQCTITYLARLIRLQENPQLPVAPLPCKFIGKKNG